MSGGWSGGVVRILDTDVTGPPLLCEVLPEFFLELVVLLCGQGDQGLSVAMWSARFHAWCDCATPGCQSFWVGPAPGGSFGVEHHMVALLAEDRTMINLDVVRGRVLHIEVLGRPALRDQFRRG